MTTRRKVEVGILSNSNLYLCCCWLIDVLITLKELSKHVKQLQNILSLVTHDSKPNMCCVKNISKDILQCIKRFLRQNKTITKISNILEPTAIYLDNNDSLSQNIKQFRS